jgi:hypothetical protein
VATSSFATHAFGGGDDRLPTLHSSMEMPVGVSWRAWLKQCCSAADMSCTLGSPRRRESAHRLTATSPTLQVSRRADM